MDGMSFVRLEASRYCNCHDERRCSSHEEENVWEGRGGDPLLPGTRTNPRIPPGEEPGENAENADRPSCSSSPFPSVKYSTCRNQEEEEERQQKRGATPTPRPPRLASCEMEMEWSTRPLTMVMVMVVATVTSSVPTSRD